MTLGEALWSAGGEQTALPGRQGGEFHVACCSVDRSGAFWAGLFGNGALTLKGTFLKSSLQGTGPAAVIPQASKNGSKENRASRFSHKEEREGKGGFHGWRSETGGLLRIEVSKNKKSRLRNPSPHAAGPGEKEKVRASPDAPAAPLLGVYQEKGKRLSTRRLTHR